MKEIRIKTKERTEFRILIVNRAKPQNQNPQKNWTENGIFWTKILSWFRKCRKWKCKTIYETVCKWNNLMWKRKKKHLIELKITLLVKRKKKNNRIFIIRDTQITCTHRDTNAPHPISTCRQRNFPPMFSCQFYHFFQFISMNGYRTLSVININRISFHSHHIDPRVVNVVLNCCWRWCRRHRRHTQSHCVLRFFTCTCCTFRLIFIRALASSFRTIPISNLNFKEENDFF